MFSFLANQFKQQTCYSAAEIKPPKPPKQPQKNKEKGKKKPLTAKE